MKIKKLLLLFSIFTLAIAVSACEAQTPEEKEKQITEILTIKEDDNIKGPSDAKATLIEYSDFECPACASVYPLVKQLSSDYSDDLRIVYRHFPLQQHFQAIPAARAAEAAGQQGKFFEMHDKLFENHDEWTDTPTHKEIFFRYAEELGLDMDKFEEVYDSRDTLKRIERDRDDDRTLTITGTPTFYLNGEKVTFRSADQAKQIIEDAIAGKGVADEGAQPL